VKHFSYFKAKKVKIFSFLSFLFLSTKIFSQQNCSVNLVSNQYVCQGSNATITANTSGMGQNPNFSWMVNGNQNQSNNNSITIQINGNNPTTVICTASNNNNNCNDSDTIQIYSVNPGTIASNQYVCNGSIPITINSTNGGSTNIPNTSFSYQWYSSPNQNGPWTIIPNETNASFTPGPTQTTIYFRREFTLTVNGVDYPCNTSPVSVTNIVAPNINNPLCVNLNSNAQLSLNFNPSLPNNVTATYAWSGPNNFTSASSSPTVNSITAIKTGTYNVSVAISWNGSTLCTYQLSTTVNLNPATPTFNIPANGCQGNAYTPSNFNPAPNTTYQWNISPQNGSGGSTGLNTANPSFVFSNIGTYSITVTATQNGCSTTSSAQNITMSNFNIDAPAVELNGTYYNVQVVGGQNTIAICAGLSNTNINILNNNIAPNCAGAGCNPQGVTYTYSINGSPPANFGAQVIGNIVYGNNPLVITATYLGCTMTYNANIYSGSNPFVSLGTNNSIGLCPGDNLNFSINPVSPNGTTNPPGTTYAISGNDAPAGIWNTYQNLTSVTTVTHTYNSTSCGMSYQNAAFPNNTFYAQVVAQNLCGQTISTVSPITVNALPTANFTVSDSTICNNQTITVTNTGNSGSVIGNSPPYLCSAQGKFYWTITGGTLGTNFTIPATQTLGFQNLNYASTVSNGSPVLNVTFLTAGYYTITQYYYNSCGTAIKVRNICVINPAGCQFNTNPVSGCSPLTVSTNNTSTAPTCNGSPVPLSYVWTVSNQGAGTTAVISNTTAQNPNLTLTNTTAVPQVFTVSLNVIPMEPAAPNLPFSTNLLFCPTPIAGSPVVGSISGANSPWTAVVSGLSGAAGIPAGTYITATNGTGRIGTGGVYTVSSSTTSTINYSAAGGNPPLAGTVTNLLRAISGSVTAPTNLGNGSWSTTITGLCSTAGITVGSIITATNVLSGSLGSGICTVTAVGPNSITVTSTGGSSPTVGTITNLSVTTCTALCTQTVNVNPIPIFTPTSITTCNSPYSTNVNLQSLTNIPATFTWQATDNTNITGESTTQQNTSSIQDILTNNSNVAQTITYNVTPTSTPVTAPGCVGATQMVTININTIVPGIISSDQTICAGGNPANLTGTAPSGIGTLSYQWQSSSSPNGPWTNIPGATLANYDPPVTSTTIYYQRIVNYLSNGVTCQGISNVVSIIVNSIASGSISAPQILCQGSDPSALSIVNSPNGSGTLSYQWFSGSGVNGPWLPIGGQNTTSYDPPIINTNTYYQLTTTTTLNGNTCSAATSPILITIVTLTPGSIATNQTICIGGDPTAFTSVAATANNGASISYQWQSSLDNVTWNNIIGANAATYDPPVLNDTIWYRRLVSASLGGNVICTSVSNILMIIVINDPTIANPPLAYQSICQGGIIQALTFSYTGGTGAPSFQWYSSTNAGGPWSLINGATQQSYTPATFNTIGNYYYSVVVNQNISGCSTGNSPAAQINVVGDPTVTNPSAANYCQNSASVLPLSVTASNGVALGYTYQWYSNTINNTSSGTIIAGATTNTYTPPVSSVGNLYYYCIVTQPGGLGCSVTSASALISVSANPVVTVQPIQSQTLCIGGTASPLTFTLTGGSGVASYQWFSNTVNSNTNGTLIPNATNANYTPPVSNLPDTLYYYCVITFSNNTGCPVATTATGRIITIDDPIISVPPSAQTVCVGGTISPALTVSISGGAGNPIYQWYSSSNANGPWTLINGATQQTYVPGTLNATGNYFYSALVNQSVSGCSAGQSQAAQITVVNEITITNPTSSTYCQNAANVNALSVNASGGNGTAYNYQWYSTPSNNNSSGTAINGATSSNYTPPVSTVGTLYYYCVVSQLPSQNSCSTNSAQTAIIVNPGPSFSTQPNPLQSVCVNGTLSPLVVAVSGGNGVPSYQWYSNNTNNNSTGTIIPNATSASYTLPAATQVGTTYYYCIITFAGASGCASVISNLAQVNVSNGPSITTQPVSTQTICVGGTISPALTVAITGGAGNPLYQWYTVNGATYTAIPNATSSTYAPPVFNAVGIFNYAVLVNQSSGGCSTGYSTNATVNVVTDPSLTAPTPSTSYCQNAGNVQALSVTASGGNGMAYTYQWYSNTVASTTNSVAIPNATSNTYTPPVNSTGTFYYYCVVTQGTGIGCSFASSFASITVTAGPIINNQPLASQTICVGGTLSALNISYTGGSGAATYQWYSNVNNSNVGGTIIPNATSNTYTPPITASAGTYYYYCEISFGNNSGCSLITSNVSTINVLADPVISTAPASQSICVGGTVSPALTVAISGGSGNATYQWYSVPSVGVYNLINGATNSSYTPPVFNNPGNFNYSVIVNQNVSGCSTGQSASAVISVGQDPIVSAPTGATYCQNAGIVNALSVSASGGNNTGMLYQWYSSPTNSNSGGTLIPNATASTYIPSTTNIGTIYYYCIVSQSPSGNNCATNSTQAAITITSAPAFSTQPIPNQTICTGGAATNLTVAYSSGSGIPSYQWYSNNINANNGGSSIAGAINPTYTPSTQTPGTFYYYCVLTFAQSGCSTITSNVATVTVNPGPSITTQPTASQSICVGGTLATPLSVSFTNGVGAASYQWYSVNGATNTILNGATSNTYNPPAFGSSGSFSYIVQITLSGGGCGSIQSNLAQVNVALDPTVTAPIGAAYCNGFNPVTPLSINASGGNPNVAYTYQWYSNGQNNTNTGAAIAGATTNTYTPANNTNGTLYYYCVVSQSPPSSGCQNTSNTAAIVVTASPSISVQPIANQTACIGGTLSALSMSISGGSGIPTYQWYSNNVNSLIGSSPIGGATNPTYLPPSNQAGTTYYYCIISFPALTCSTVTTSIVSVLIHPDPSISIQPIASQAVCTGTTINTPLSASFTGGFGTASYQWNTNNGATNTPINGAASATFTPSIFNQAGTYNYSVSISLSGNGCDAILSAPAQIVVSPVPTVNSISSVTYCNADITTAIPFSGTPVGVSFSWQNSNVNIGLGASGTGNLPSFTAANLSPNAIVGTITVTPQLTTLNTTCSGNSTNFTITINPYQNVNDPQDLILCHGTGVNGIQFSGTAAINNWTNDLPALGIGASGSGTLPAFLAVNNGIAPIVAHLSVTPSFNGITTCPGDIETFTITILPAPTVSVPGSQLVCGGTYTNTINFTGTATSYQWTNNQPSIGLAASGTGNIPAFLANATGSNVVANIVVTPVYTFSGLTCTGNAQTTQITVIPSPSMNPLPNQVFCNNAPTGTVNIMGNATSFPWTTNNPSIGIASSGTGSIPSFNALNNTSSPVTSLITVTPTNMFNGLTCTSPVQSFSIMVNPTPTMNSVPDQYVCDQTNASPVVFSGNATGYLWTNSNGTIGLGNSGSGNIPAFPATNTQAIPVTANVSVIPTYTFQGVTCNGPIELFTITVLPTPQMSAISNQTVCSGTSTNAINFVGSGTNYIWSNNTPSIGLAGNGTGNISSFIAVGGNIITNATINVIPVYTFNNVSCYGSNQSGTITVLPIPSVNQPPNLVLCNNTNSGNIVFSGNATSVSWSNPNPSIGLASSGSGNIASFVGMNGGVNQTTTPITLIPGFSQGGLSCTGNPISFNILINPTPSVSPTNDISVCHQNQTVPLNFTGSGTAYTWTNSIPAIGLAASGNGNILPFTAINNTNSLVTGLIIITPQFTQSGLTCVGAPDYVNINVEPIPSIQYSALSQTICSGISTNAITLSSSYAPANLTWNITSTSPSISGISSFSGVNSIPAMTLVNSSNNAIQISYQGTAITPLAACTSAGPTGTISINPAPLINIINDTTICNNSAINYVLTANMNSTFTWGASSNPNVNGESTGPVTSSTIYNVLQNNTNALETVIYTVTPNSVPQGCAGASMSFSVDIVPDIVVTTPLIDSVCSGDATGIYLTSNLPANFTWQAVNNPYVTGETTNIQSNFYINDFLVNNTVYDQIVDYHINLTSGTYACFGIPSVISVVVHPSISLTNSNAVTICSGDNIGLALAATVNSAFIWSATNNGIVTGETVNPQNNAYINDILINNSNTAQIVNYAIDVTSIDNGCTEPNLPLTVTVNPLPFILNQDTTICSGQGVDMNISTSVPANSFWYAIINPLVLGETPTTTTSGIINDVLVNTTPNPSIVNYVISANSLGCIAPNDTVSVTVLVQPNVSFTVNTNPLCSDAPISFVNQSSPNYQFQWNFGDGGTSNLYSPTHLYANSGNYLAVLQGIDQSNNCSASDSLLLQINKSPDATFNTNDTIGCDELNATFFAFYQPGVTYSWDFGNGENSSQVGNVTNYYNTEGCYTVTLTLTSPEGCVSQSSQSDLICVYDSPNANISADPLEVNSLEPQIHFYNQSINAISYLWNLGDGTLSYDDNPVYTYPNWAADYNVILTAYNEIGCIDTASISIHVYEDLIVYIPNSFTPNGDEANQLFYPVLAQGVEKDFIDFKIYNRWGQLVFESYNPEIGWDGSYGNKGRDCEIGTYTWVITVQSMQDQDAKQITGHVNLIR
jgi:gliding motility-associated-like protein